jgi:hypothetical protein
METPQEIRRMTLEQVGASLIQAGGPGSPRGAVMQAELLRRQTETLVRQTKTLGRYTALTAVIAIATVATAIATWLLLLLD